VIFFSSVRQSASRESVLVNKSIFFFLFFSPTKQIFVSHLFVDSKNYGAKTQKLQEKANVKNVYEKEKKI
jgi:hypothetical protein